jgi:hypothetical protein
LVIQLTSNPAVLILKGSEIHFASKITIGYIA